MTTTEDPQIPSDEPEEQPQEIPDVIGPPDDPDAPDVEF
jgi:hypothetical protein